jgi:uncharacterized protein (DUF433 family)
MGQRGARVGDVDVRVDVPLYTLTEVAEFVEVPKSTLRYWVTNKQLVRALPRDRRGDAYLPFMAVAEAEFIHNMRRSGLRLAAVEEGVTALRKHLGPGWLQRDRLAHDGVDILRNLADQGDPEWTRARDAQAGIPGYIDIGLEHIEFDTDGIPGRVRLAKYAGAEVIIDPRFGFGQPILDEQGVRVQDVAELFLAGDSIAVVSEEFGVAEPVVESIVRSYARRRAA